MLPAFSRILKSKLSLSYHKEKNGKDKRNTSNWRPISFINVDAKIESKTIETRLQKVLPEIIHFNQNAYVKGRTIFDALRTIDDILEYTERNKINGLLVAIDFQKANDSINQGFTFKALSIFNFGPSLIRWIQFFYKLKHLQDSYEQRLHDSSF